MFKLQKKDTNVFFANFEHISHLVLMFLLLASNRRVFTGLTQLRSVFLWKLASVIFGASQFTSFIMMKTLVLKMLEWTNS